MLLKYWFWIFPEETRVLEKLMEETSSAFKMPCQKICVRKDYLSRLGLGTEEHVFRIVCDMRHATTERGQVPQKNFIETS